MTPFSSVWSFGSSNKGWLERRKPTGRRGRDRDHEIEETL